MKISAFRDVTSCSWAYRYQSFGGAFFLHFRSGLVGQAWKEGVLISERKEQHHSCGWINRSWWQWQVAITWSADVRGSRLSMRGSVADG